MKSSRIFWFIGVFLIGLGGGMIHIGLGIMAAGFMSLFCSYLEFEKEEKDGNKNHEEANTESSD
jgi:hypothetical protein